MHQKLQLRGRRSCGVTMLFKGWSNTKKAIHNKADAAPLMELKTNDNSIVRHRAQAPLAPRFTAAAIAAWHSFHSSKLQRVQA